MSFSVDVLANIAIELQRGIGHQDRFQRLITTLRQVLECDASALLRYDSRQFIPLAIDGLAKDVLGRRFALEGHPRLEAIARAGDVVRFPADFSRNLDTFQTAPMQLILDGRNSNSAQIAANYLQQIVKNYQQELLEGKPKPNNSELVVRNWYNPNLDYKWFVVPSLIAMITTIGVMIVTSLSVAREREQGTLDQLLVSPLATWQIFVGKAVPALIVATFQATIVLGVGIWAYQIPFAGSLALFYFTMVIYGLSLVGFGLLISALCSTQQQAFIGVFVFMMPAILLSGYVSPVENMPVWLQDLTWVNPIRHFTDITKQIYLKDASLDIVWGSLWPLLVIAATTGSAAYAMFRRKIA